MTIDRRLGWLLFPAGIAADGARPALALACSRAGNVVSCDDGRRGLWSGDAILWPDGTRSSASMPHSRQAFSALSKQACDRRSRHPRPSGRPKSRVTQPSNGNKIHATATITD
jgi:hypothetical protein